MSIKHKTSILLLLFSWGLAFSQSPNLDSMDVYLTDRYKYAIDNRDNNIIDSLKPIFKSEVIKLLKAPESFDYNFGFIGMVKSSDDKLRIRNTIYSSAYTNPYLQYLSFIQIKDKTIS